MAETKIEWTATRLPDGSLLPGFSFNPWVGCTKVSRACDGCYAEAWAKRSGIVKWGNEPRHRTSASNWQGPLKWNREAEAAGIRRKVFCASLADVFDNQVDPAWRIDLFRLIGLTPHLDWLLLTKRPQNIAKMLPSDYVLAGKPPHNIWLGTTVENQEEADRRIPHLLAVPAKVHFLSCEPLLGPVDLSSFLYWKGSTGLEWSLPPSARRWVITGGESGPHARPSHPDWFRWLRDQCAAAGAPHFFKQHGDWCAPELLPPNTKVSHIHDYVGDCYVTRVGKKAAGSLLDGIEHKAMPA